MKLRTYLFLLVAVALLPALIFSVFMLTAQQKQEFATLEHGMRDTTRALSAALDREFIASIQSLKVLAASDALDKRRLSEFYGEMKTAQAAYGRGWLNMSLSDPSGNQLINLRLPFGSPIPRIELPEFIGRIVQTKEPAISDLFRAPITGLPTVIATVPVFEGGQVKYLLNAGLPPALLLNLLTQQKLPSGWIAVIIDRNKIIVARTQGIDKLLGTPAIPELAAETSKAEEGWFQTVTRDNVGVYTAFARSRLSGWTVALGVPAQQFDAPVRRSLLVTAAGSVLLLLLGSLFAAIFAKRITRSATALSAGAKALGKGETLRLGALRVAELDEVAHEIETAPVNRKRAEEALRESEARHRTILRTAMDGFWRVDTEGRLLEVNEAYCRMSGYSEQELLAMSIPDLEPAEKPADTAAHIQRVVAQGKHRFESRHRRKDGSSCAVEVSAQYKPAQGGHLVAFLRDITEGKRAETQLREQLEELRRWQAVMIAREERNIDLKREVDELLRRLGRADPLSQPGGVISYQ